MEDDLPAPTCNSGVAADNTNIDFLRTRSLDSTAYGAGRRPLASESSPMPSMIDENSSRYDNTSLVPEKDALQDVIELSTYDHASLTDRYLASTRKHRELHKLNSAYYDIIHGSSPGKALDDSIEQLREEAGREGLRAKAYEADVLRPIIQEAGGLDAMMSHAQSFKSLIEQAGSLRALEDSVEDAQRLRGILDGVGGLSGLRLLIVEFNTLYSRRHDYDTLKASIDGPDGMEAKAIKYDQLQRTFTTVKQELPSDVAAVQGQYVPAGTSGERRSRLPLLQSAPALGTAAMMNPARARLLLEAPPKKDPNRDLYDPTPPKWSGRKTGSNNIPLGVRKQIAHPTGQNQGKGGRKRQHDESQLPRTTNWKRHQTNLDRLLRLMSSEEREFESKVLRPNPSLPSKPVTAEQAHPGQSPVMTPTLISPATVLSTVQPISAKAIKVGKCPIALWIGISKPGLCTGEGLIKADQIPFDLGKFLAGEMMSCMGRSNGRHWNTMVPNTNICILSYINDDLQPYGQQTERRACKTCLSAMLGHHQPCAWLQEIDGVRTVVFMPLIRNLRVCVLWKEKRYWILSAK